MVALASADVSDEWMDWECPGFPCSVVNYFDNRANPPHTDFRQACTPLSTMAECRKLINGENFAADNGDHTIAGWHNSTKAHPCKNPYGPCIQDGCLQGTNAKCKALCDNLNLIFPYHDRCYKTCDTSCTDTEELFMCSECTAHGHGPDGCGCGYCGSYGGCGYTCGHDPNQAPLGPKCINLPPSLPPTPVLPPAPAPGYTTPPPEPTPTPTPSPTPTPTPTPGPNPNLPKGGCCSWAGPKEIDECGESTAWCVASPSNCEACEGHWACPDGPCPAPPPPAPIPSGGCCSWASAGQQEECGDSTSWCKANAGNCRTCAGHWVYPDNIV